MGNSQLAASSESSVQTTAALAPENKLAPMTKAANKKALLNQGLLDISDDQTTYSARDARKIILELN